MAMTEAVGAAVQVEIHEIAPVDVPEAVALAAADHQRDSQAEEGLDAARDEIVVGHGKDAPLAFGMDR
jgi:hypothetical protein